MRCLECGCSRLDSQGLNCVRCGRALGVRWERCYITEDTKAKLLAHADDLRTFGITLEEHSVLGKSSGTAEAIGLTISIASSVLTVADSLDSGVLRKLVLFLGNHLHLPNDEILRLRLDEPEQVLDILSVDERTRPDGPGSDHHTGV